MDDIVIFQVKNNMLPDYSLENLAALTSHGQADRPVIPWLNFTALLKIWNNDHLFPFLWYFKSVLRHAREWSGAMPEVLHKISKQ